MFRSICPTVSLENPKADYQTARRLEQFRVSGQAVYMAAFPGTKYLPFQAVERAWKQDASLALTGCCGKTLPMTVVRMKYVGGYYQNFMFEKPSSAAQLLELLRERGVLLEREGPKAENRQD